MVKSVSGSLAHGVPCIFVHLTSGDVEELCPADSVRVGLDTIGVFNGAQPVAQFIARDVMFCSSEDISPFPLS
jgi:hypothetical protein